MIWPFNLLFKENIPTPTTKEKAWAEGYQYYGASKMGDYNPDDLIAWKGYNVYQKMLDDDQVKASFELIRNMICSRNWFFEVKPDDEQQEKIRQFFEFNLEEVLQGTFTQALKSILLAKAHGFSLTEKVFETVEHEGNLRWAIKSLKPKPFQTFRLRRDDFGNLLSVIQEQNGRNVIINPNKFIYYVHQADLDPIWGKSDFRAAYSAYWAKSNIQKFWNIYDERLSGGTWAFRAKEDAPSMSNGELEDVKSILKTMTSQTGVIVPSGFELDIMQPNDTDAFRSHIAFLDKQISKSMLVPNLLGFSEQGNTGSFAQAKIQLDTFLNVIKCDGDLLADTLNEQLFKELAFWNFDSKVFPRFKFEAFTEEQKQKIVESWINASKDGVVINTYEDELKTRSLLGYGVREEEDKESINGDEDDKDNALPSDDIFRAPLPDFVEKSDGNAIERVSFGPIEDLFDSSQSIFVKQMSSPIDKMLSETIEEVRTVFKEIQSQEKPKVESSLKKINKAISPKTKSEFNIVVKDNLRSMYRSGRLIAKDEILEATKTLPKKFSDEVGLILTLSTPKAVKFHGEKEWSVGDFVDGITTQEIEKILSATGFFITGVTSEDILAAAKQVLISGVESGQSITEIVEDLKEIVSPLIGKAERDPKTGTLTIDKKERARLETIARTNLSTIFNQSQLSVFTDPDLGDFVEAFEYTALIDTRTTAFCRGYDNFIRPKNDPIWSSITPPNHFNCRSRLVAVTAVDIWESTKKLPSDKEGLFQPGKGFGNVKSKSEL